MPFSKEVKGEWFGVSIPEWLRALDCRSDNSDAFARAPWGAVLLGSEKAAADIGLRAPGEYNDTTPVSCQTYTDARTASPEELRKQVEDMVEQASKLRDEYLNAKPAKEGDGGSVLYMPVAIAMCNFGWSIIADNRNYIVRAWK